MDPTVVPLRANDDKFCEEMVDSDLELDYVYRARSCSSVDKLCRRRRQVAKREPMSEEAKFKTVFFSVKTVM